MSEMIERVKQALIRVEDEQFLEGIDFEAMARAAIEAMREPSEAMCDAVAVADPQSIRELWQAMIDAALGKKP